MTYLADVFMWGFCWLAYRLALIVPYGRLYMWLLPFAGYYAYHDPEFHTWRWSGRNR